MFTTIFSSLGTWNRFLYPNLSIRRGTSSSSYSCFRRGVYFSPATSGSVSYTHLRAHETRHDLVCRLLLEKKKNKNQKTDISKNNKKKKNKKKKNETNN